MKKFANILKTAGLLAAAAMLAAACSSPLELNKAPGGAAKAAPGYGTVSFTVGGAGARTLLPGGHDELVYYAEWSTTAAGEDPGSEKLHGNETGATIGNIQIKAGVNWTIKISAYKDEAAHTAGTPAAQAAYPGFVNVAEYNHKELGVIYLRPYAPAGTGTFGWQVTFPNGGLDFATLTASMTEESLGSPQEGLPEFPDGLPPYAAQEGLPEYPDGLPSWDSDWDGDAEAVTNDDGEYTGTQGTPPYHPDYNASEDPEIVGHYEYEAGLPEYKEETGNPAHPSGLPEYKPAVAAGDPVPIEFDLLLTGSQTKNDSDGNTYNWEVTDNTDGTYTAEGVFDLEPASYDFRLELKHEDGIQAGESEVAYIYPGMATVKEWVIREDHFKPVTDVAVFVEFTGDDAVGITGVVPSAGSLAIIDIEWEYPGLQFTVEGAALGADELELKLTVTTANNTMIITRTDGISFENEVFITQPLYQVTVGKSGEGSGDSSVSFAIDSAIVQGLASDAEVADLFPGATVKVTAEAYNTFPSDIIEYVFAEWGIDAGVETDETPATFDSSDGRPYKGSAVEFEMPESGVNVEAVFDEAKLEFDSAEFNKAVNDGLKFKKELNLPAETANLQRAVNWAGDSGFTETGSAFTASKITAGETEGTVAITATVTVGAYKIVQTFNIKIYNGVSTFTVNFIQDMFSILIPGTWFDPGSWGPTANGNSYVISGSNHSGAAGRAVFKIDLGENTLSDYQTITFDFELSATTGWLTRGGSLLAYGGTTAPGNTNALTQIGALSEPASAEAPSYPARPQSFNITNATPGANSSVIYFCVHYNTQENITYTVSNFTLVAPDD